jgi:hypothetical protein
MRTVTTEDFIIMLFCAVDDQMSDVPKHPQAKLWPSELVTIGLLFALKGGYFRAFYRWLKRDYEALFVELPDRTRLQRALYVHQAWCDCFLDPPTFFTVIDTYGIELIHPVREGRSQTPLGKKGYSNRRWIVGVKLCWLLNNQGRIVAWDWDTANTHDQHFRPVAHQFDDQTITLCDHGFRKKDEPPRNLKICAHKTWSERMIVETALSLVTTVCRLKHVFHRVAEYLHTRLALVSALFNVLLTLNDQLEPGIALNDGLLSIAHFSL